MKNQKISTEEQEKIDEINIKESGAESQPKVEKPKKAKHTGEVIEEGYTDAGGNFSPLEHGKRDGWKKYKKYSDGSYEF